MTSFNMPPGTNPGMIPGNRPEHISTERLIDDLDKLWDDEDWAGMAERMKADPILGHMFNEERADHVVSNEDDILEALASVECTLEELFGRILYMRDES